VILVILLNLVAALIGSNKFVIFNSHAITQGQDQGDVPTGGGPQPPRRKRTPSA
jgi:hypothetical protein